MKQLANKIINTVKWQHLVIAFILMAGSGFFMNNNPWVADYKLEMGLLNFSWNFSYEQVEEIYAGSTEAERTAHSVVLIFDYFIAFFSIFVLAFAMALLLKKAFDDKNRPEMLVFFPAVVGLTNIISNIMLQMVNAGYPEIDPVLVVIASKCTSVKLASAVLSLFFIVMFIVLMVRRRVIGEK